tara:strand:+ start:347 stop:580 length:234 start_codon:yes stop_codon:yes gene_type:complete
MTKPTKQHDIKNMDAFDVDAMINARTQSLSVCRAFSLDEVFHDDEIYAILDHCDFATIKKLSSRRDLEFDLINALED